MLAPERVAGHLADLAPYLAVVCEAQIIDFSRRAGYGPYVKLRVPDPGLLNGMEAGQRYHLMLVKIMEDEMPATPNPEDRKPYKASQMAGAFCVDKEFWRWIKHVYGDDIQDKDGAAKWVRQACAVESRSMLDTNDAAAEIWRDIVRDFDQWKRNV